MSIEDIQKKIFNDSDFVLQEVDRLQYLYKLKEEIRYGQNREEEMYTESVAEHIYGMQICANYFLPLEDPEQRWNRQKIYEMILWHDVDEIVTGDTIGYLKTEKHRQEEAHALNEVIDNLSDVLRKAVSDSIREYEAKETIEAQFVKAIDKIETHIQVFNENGKQVLLDKATTLEQHKSIKDPFVKDFPYIKRFSEVVTNEMVEQGFFTE